MRCWRLTDRVRDKVAIAGLVVAVAAVASACGDGETSTTSTTGPKETAQKLPKLAEGWKPRRDRAVGYAIGVPPKWEVRTATRRTLFRSPDHLVAVTLTAQRDPRAFTVPPERFAVKALGALPGFKVPLDASKPTRFGGTPLKAAETHATGTQAGGLRERATLVVLRRDRLVNYTVAVLENASHPGSRLDRAVALKMIRTLRDVPPRER